MKYCTALATIFVAASAEYTKTNVKIMNGCYTDSNNAQAWRYISFTGKDWFLEQGTCQGSDNGPTKEWELRASGADSSIAYVNKISIMIDFESTGIPSEV